jgi:hypothetical protein
MPSTWSAALRIRDFSAERRKAIDYPAAAKKGDTHHNAAHAKVSITLDNALRRNLQSGELQRSGRDSR